MIPVIAERADELKQLCLRYSVRRLDLFGSAATGECHLEESDLDFMVEFQLESFSAYADAYLRPAGSPGAAFREVCGPSGRLSYQEPLLPAIGRRD